MLALHPTSPKIPFEFQTSGEDDELEEEEQAEEDKKSVKEEAEIQNSPEPPSIIAAEPINLPSLQSPTLPATSFTCEMPDCGAVSGLGNILILWYSCAWNVTSGSGCPTSERDIVELEEEGNPKPSGRWINSPMMKG